MAKAESAGFSEEEKAAMRDYAAERRERAKRKGTEGAALDAADCLAAIAKLTPEDREVGERLHSLITKTAPELAPKTWYGMPAYAIDGNVICFFQTKLKFKTRYYVLGFTDKAALDDGDMWATSFAIMELTLAVEKQIAAQVTKAAGR